MALARRFEDLAVWNEARALTREVYALVASGPLQRDWGLTDQVRRSAISTMNNVAEGFDSGSRTEFARFLRYSARSASEVQSCLYVALDCGYIDRAAFDSAYRRAERVRSLARALTRSLAKPRRQDGSGCVREESPLYGSPPEASDRVSASKTLRYGLHSRTRTPAHAPLR
jgi:four helix bundle protein